MPATDFGREDRPQWPEIDMPQAVKDAVHSFYRLVDAESEQAFEDWTALFAEDGVIEIGSKRKSGHASLRQEREESWVKIKRRDHHLYRVYTRSSAGTDLLAIGRVDVECRNGSKFSQEFAQNFLLIECDDGGYLIQKFQAWIDSEPLRKALAES